MAAGLAGWRQGSYGLQRPHAGPPAIFHRFNPPLAGFNCVERRGDPIYRIAPFTLVALAYRQEHEDQQGLQVFHLRAFKGCFMPRSCRGA